MLNTCKSNGEVPFGERISGERVSNTWAICPSLWDNPGKPGLIPHTKPEGIFGFGKFFGEG